MHLILVLRNQFTLFRALRAVRRAIVDSRCSVDDLCWKLFYRNLYNFEHFVDKVPPLEYFAASILYPWGHFCSKSEPLVSFFEHFLHFECYKGAATPKVGGNVKTKISVANTIEN